MHIKIIKKTEHRVFFKLLNCTITTFIRHFRLFSKRCPNCNGFKENGKKHSMSDCIDALVKKEKRKIGINLFIEQNDKPRPIIPTEKGAHPPDLKYPPKEPKWDKFDYAYVILSGLLIILIIFIPFGLYYKQKTMQKEAITIDCKLLNRDFKSLSGFKTKFIVNFDCGNYGILISDDKEIFRQAKENNKLTVYFGYNDYKILGI